MLAYRQRSGSIMHASDKLELCILEILVLQDIMNVNREIFGSFSRMRRRIVYLYLNRRDLSNDKYLKYKANASMFSNNVLNKIEQINSIQFNIFRIVNSINSRIWGVRRSIYKRVKMW